MQFPETLLMKCSTPKEGVDNLGPGCVDFYLQRAFPSRLTLYNDLIAGNKDLLTIGCLCILEDGGALLGSSGDCLQTLEAFRSWGCQLDCAISGDSN